MSRPMFALGLAAAGILVVGYLFGSYWGQPKPLDAGPKAETRAILGLV